MRYRITHTTKYAYTEPVAVCHNKVHLSPRATAVQSCTDYRLLVVPEPAVIEARQDYFGNRIEYFSLIDSHRGLAITSTSFVDVAAQEPCELDKTAPWEEVAAGLAQVPPQADVEDCLFAFGSEFAQPDSRFAEYARVSFSPGRPIAEAAMDLTRRIYKEFEYSPQTTNVSTPVAQVFEQRTGVCQDFAHLQIVCLRSLGLAARYVSGYLRTVPPPGKPRLVGADGSHAWVSVHCGPQGWIDFDPTNNVIPTTDHITVAYGRDYGDVCPIQGVFVGGGDHTMSVAVDVEAQDAAAGPA